MDDFTSNNPDSLDGDFKALLVMRRNRQNQLSEQEEREAQLVAKTIQKFVDNKKRKTSMLLLDHATALNVNELQDTGEIDYNQIRADAFDAVEDDDLAKLQTSLQDVLKLGGLDKLQQPKTDESLLHRALSRELVNMNIVKYLLKCFNDKEICTCQRLMIGGKKSMISTLHVATDNGHTEAAKMIVLSLTTEGVRQQFLLQTTVIVPEGQRPRPLTSLHIAAKRGNNDLVTYFIKTCKMSVDLANDKGDRPILWAANDNQPHTVALLIGLGADVNAQNDKGSSALHWACRNGHTEVVRVLLKESKDINVNIRRRLGLVCPIIAASAMGFSEIVTLLIKHNADIDTRMKSGHRALHFAAVEGHLDIVMQLLDAGASINILDDQGNDAMLLAASHGQHLVVTFLAKCGSKFNHSNHAGKTVWDFALEQKDTKLMKALVDHVISTMSSGEAQSLTNGILQISDLENNAVQLRSGSAGRVKPNTIVLPPGITPLHAAASIGDNDIIKSLLAMSIDPFGTDDDESTFIHVAAKHNQVETLKSFATEALCRTKDYRGYTPLHVACEHACNEAIAIVLSLSNLSLTNNHNQTALHLATRSTRVSHKNTKEIVTQMILHHDWTVVHVQDKNKRSALHSAVLAGNSAIIPELHHLSPNVLDANGSTPVHIAILNGDHEMLHQLIKTFSSVGRTTINLNKWDESGESPLHVAAKHLQEKMIETLIKCGADLALPNVHGRTVLHEVALLMAENRADEHIYMQVFETIRDTCIQWWCRRIRKSVPNQHSDDNAEYYKKALMYLITSVYDQEGLNVLQYAANLAASDLVITILNTPNVFRLVNAQHRSVTYDVSDLLPFTSTHTEPTTHQTKKMIAVSPSDDTESDPLAEKAEKEVDISSPLSVAELLVKVDTPSHVASILDVSPFKNIVDSYWSVYQKLFAASFLFHVFIMSLYSHYGIMLLGCLSDSGTNSTTSTSHASSYVRPWQAEVGAATCLIWPICLLIYDSVTIIKLLVNCKRQGASKTYSSIKRQSEYLAGFLILQLCGFLYSTLTITWYAMNRVCHPSQDYLLALSYIFGWVYSINFTRGFKQIHHFSIILQHILFRDMLRFGLIYLFILLAFSFAYGALVQAIPTLRISGGDSIFLVFNWMIGMSDFDTNGSEINSLQKSEAMIQVVYAAYIILSTIVLLNLLIAMMSDSYADVRKMSEVMWKVGSLRLPLEFEEGLGRSYYRPQHLTLDVDAKRWFIVIPEKQLIEKPSSSATVIHDLTMKVEKLVEESRARESRVLALLEARVLDASNESSA